MMGFFGGKPKGDPPPPPPSRIVPPKSGAAARPVKGEFGYVNTRTRNRPWGFWVCEYCSTRNDAHDKRCSECGAPWPVRKVETIDVGEMSMKEAEQTLERVRREIKITGPDKPV